jgi:hypothetical protein
MTESRSTLPPSVLSAKSCSVARGGPLVNRRTFSWHALPAKWNCMNVRSTVTEKHIIANKLKCVYNFTTSKVVLLTCSDGFWQRIDATNKIRKTQKCIFWHVRDCLVTTFITLFLHKLLNLADDIETRWNSCGPYQRW